MPFFDGYRRRVGRLRADGLALEFRAERIQEFASAVLRQRRVVVTVEECPCSVLTCAGGAGSVAPDDRQGRSWGGAHPAHPAR